MYLYHLSSKPPGWREREMIESAKGKGSVCIRELSCESSQNVGKMKYKPQYLCEVHSSSPDKQKRQYKLVSFLKHV